MKKTEMTSLRTKSVAELKKNVLAKQAELAKPDCKKARILRKEVAQTLTIIRELELMTK